MADILRLFDFQFRYSRLVEIQSTIEDSVWVYRCLKTVFGRLEPVISGMWVRPITSLDLA